ncbi:MAG: CBS domain-containing protein [Isosphaeraceae bacterium]|nr:CBS domain-containing protein [Isosphaeraceae bacterium]
MQIRDVLKAKGGGAIIIGPEATVNEAIARLVEFNIGSLPVVDGRGRLVGIFTERDVLRGVHRDCERFLHQRIADVMTPDPITCTPEDHLHEAMGRMSSRKVGQLPIVANGEVVGVVSVGDVIKLMFEQVEAENRHLLEYLYGPG